MCLLIVLFILIGLKKAIPKSKIGIYRDDALITISKRNKWSRNWKYKEKMHEFANKLEIRLSIENRATTINYLDKNFNLNNHTYYPYKNPNSKINYVNSKSNHPPTNFKQISKMIEHKLSKHSDNDNLLKIVRKDFEDALKLNGYKYEIKYMNQKINIKIKQKRKCVWFNHSVSQLAPM